MLYSVATFMTLVLSSSCNYNILPALSRVSWDTHPLAFSWSALFFQETYGSSLQQWCLLKKNPAPLLSMCVCYLSGASSMVRKRVNWETTKNLMLLSSHRSLSRFPISACTCRETKQISNFSYYFKTLVDIAPSVCAAYLWTCPPLLRTCAILFFHFLLWKLHQLTGLDLTSTERTACHVLCAHTQSIGKRWIY